MTIERNLDIAAIKIQSIEISEEMASRGIYIEAVDKLLSNNSALIAEVERLRKRVCDKCGGSGYDGVLVGRACSKCNGSGRP